MDSLLSPPNDQRHEKDVVPLVPGPTAVSAQLDGPVHDFDGWFASAAIAPQPIDASAEESCPAPSVEMPIPGETPQPTPDIHPPQVPSPAASKLMDQLDELASDLAAKGRSSSEEAVETMPETSPVSIELQAVEPSIQVPPRSDFGHNPFAAGSQPARRRMIVTSAGVCLAALLGAGIAWQSDFIAPTKSTNEFEPRRNKTGCHYVRSAAFGKRDPDPTGPSYTSRNAEAIARTGEATRDNGAGHGRCAA